MKTPFRAAFRRAAISVVVAFGALTATVVTATPAAAVGPCGSSYSHIGHYAVNSGSQGTGAYIDVYWSSSAQRNCAVLNGTGKTYGSGARKGILIWANGYYDRYDQDDRDYKYYAGPVYTPSGINMSGRCINVEGIVEFPNGEIAAGHRYNVHCG
ncbi:hypothetical protein AB0I28_17000 [Phytomonospora sp. NPDC050363]|uniref:hypothetical protein n=1 Tax=Phytomonospora sp. NPDC050363 TaxID=3155642 RepID=UPI0033C47B7E